MVYRTSTDQLVGSLGSGGLVGSIVQKRGCRIVVATVSMSPGVSIELCQVMSRRIENCAPAAAKMRPYPARTRPPSHARRYSWVVSET